VLAGVSVVSVQLLAVFLAIFRKKLYKIKIVV
jgi:hypothetical protein